MGADTMVPWDKRNAYNFVRLHLEPLILWTRLFVMSAEVHPKNKQQAVHNYTKKKEKSN